MEPSNPQLRLLIQLVGLFLFAGIVEVSAEDPPPVSDPCKNPLVEITSVTLVPSPIEGESQIEITFDKDISVDTDCALHGFAALNVPIDPVADLSMAQLEDLNNDGSLDLVVGRSGEILVFPNSAVPGSKKLILQQEPLLLASRKYWDYGSSSLEDPDLKFGTSVTFSDLDGDGDLDIICGSSFHGHISFFRGTGMSSGWPTFSADQEILKFENSSGNHEFIATATSDNVNFVDISQAAPEIFDFDGDDILDLLVGDAKETNGGNLHVFLGKGVTTAGIHAGVQIPLFKESFMLKAGIDELPVAVENRSEGATTPSFFDVNLDGFLDLVVCQTHGAPLYYPYLGRSSANDEMLFGEKIVFRSLSGLALNFPGSGIVAKSMDLNLDGNLDFITTSLSSIAPFRKEIRIHLSNLEGEIDQTGFVVGTKQAPQRFRGSMGGESWASGDLNRDGNLDLVFGQNDGRLGISFATDTGDTFDPQYSSFSYVLNSDDSVFRVNQLDVNDYPHNGDSSHDIFPTVVDIDGVVEANGQTRPDAIVLGLKDCIMVLPLLGVGDAGCVKIGQPYSITPDFGTPAVERELQIEFGHFSAAGVTANGPINGAILVSRGNVLNDRDSIVDFWSIGVTDPGTTNQIAQLSGPSSPIVQGGGGYSFPVPPFPSAAARYVRYTNPTLCDVDDDGYEDLIIVDSPGIFWLRNTSTSATPAFAPPILLKSDGEEIVTPEITPDSALRLVRRNPNKLLLMGGESTPSRLFGVLPSPQSGFPLESENSQHEALIKHLLATYVAVVGQRKIVARFPVLLEVGDAIAINRLFVNGVEDELCSFSCVPIQGTDNDGDGLFDEWEYERGYDATVDNGAADSDGDGLSNLDEWLIGSDPSKRDSDGDGVFDLDDDFPNQHSFQPFMNYHRSWSFEKAKKSGNSHNEKELNNRAVIDLGGTQFSQSGGLIGGGAMELNGVGLNFQTDLVSDIGDSNDFSIGFWMKFEPGTFVDLNEEHIIFTIRAPQEDPLNPLSNYYLTLTYQPATGFRLRSPYADGASSPMYSVVGFGSVGDPFPEYPLDDGRWHYIAYVSEVDGNDTENTIYVDIESDSRSGPRAIDLLGDVQKGNIVLKELSLEFGKSLNHTALAGPLHLRQDPGIKGFVDEISVWNSNVSFSDIKQLVDSDGDKILNPEDPRPLFKDQAREGQDLDGDGILDLDEDENENNKVDPGETSPFLFDTDGDKFPDGWEKKFFSGDELKIAEPGNGPNDDADGDGISNWDEYLAGTNPMSFEGGPGGVAVDTDNDGISDDDEIAWGSDPDNPDDRPIDAVITDIENSRLSNDVLDPICGDLGNLGGFSTNISNSSTSNVQLSVGDVSSSQSEQWALKVGSQTITSRGFGEFLYGEFVLSKTLVHDVTLQHVATDPEDNRDIDYFAHVLPFNQGIYDVLDDDIYFTNLAQLPPNHPDLPEKIERLRERYIRIQMSSLDVSKPEGGIFPVGSDFVLVDNEFLLGAHFGKGSNFENFKDLEEAEVPGVDFPKIPNSFMGKEDAEEFYRKKAYLVPVSKMNLASSLSFTGNDAAGPRYRKIALNGRPFSDEKPEQEEETDHRDQQTYVDAFDLGLHHDNSFVYVPLAGTNLVLQATATLKENTWNERSGLRPDEVLNEPFGPCWTSNLCAYAEVISSVGEPANDDPVAVNVVDEGGRGQRFGTYDGIMFFPWPSARTDKKTYLNTLGWENLDFGGQLERCLVYRKKFGNTLTYRPSDAWHLYSDERLDLDGAETGRLHEYLRLHEVKDRFGNQLLYDYGDQSQLPNKIRLFPSRIHCPQRANQEIIIAANDCRTIDSITDPRGNTTSFNYVDYGSNTDLRVVSAQSGTTYDFPFLTGITHPDTTVSGYWYDTQKDTEIRVSSSEPNGEIRTDHFHTNLTKITGRRGASHEFSYGFNRSVSSYSANKSEGGIYVPAVSLRDVPPAIRVEAEKKIEAWNRIVEVDGNGIAINRLQYGLPRVITSVALPIPADPAGNSANGLASVVFAHTPDTKLYFGPPTIGGNGKPTVTAKVGTIVTDAVGNATTYSFGGVSAELVDVDLRSGRSSSKSLEWMVYYRSLTVGHGVQVPAGQNPTDPENFHFASRAGSESYTFDLAAGLALKSINDFSGNSTSWEYADQWDGSLGYDQTPGLSEGGLQFTKWADPTKKTDGLRRTEEYVYDSKFRIMKQSIDVNGTVTEYEIDGANGNRMSTTVTGADDVVLRKETYAYDNAAHPAFMTKRTVEMLQSVSGEPWEVPLVTEYIPDSRGRVFQEIVNPGGLNLTTEMDYDLNNNKVAVTDPKGNITTFEYDSMNRLLKVTYPSAETSTGVRQATKENFYDRNSNLVGVKDEEGNFTLMIRDQLNRITNRVVDMDRLDLAFQNATDNLVTNDAQLVAGEADLVVFTTYNAVSSPVEVTDPRGIVTLTQYDAIQRPTTIFTGLTLAQIANPLAAASSDSVTHTSLFYENSVQIPGVGAIRANPGRSAFDESGFSPSRILRHNAVETENGVVSLTNYQIRDSVYRATRTFTEYSPGSFSNSATTYSVDAQGNYLGVDNNGKESLISKSTGPPVDVVNGPNSGGPLITESKTTLSEDDGLGRSIRAVDALGTPLEIKSISEYTSTGLLFRATVAQGSALARTSETNYDSAGRPTDHWAPSPVSGLIDKDNPDPMLQSPHAHSDYDKNGNVQFLTDPRGNSRESIFDSRDRKIKDLSPSVVFIAEDGTEQINGIPQVVYSYDGVGNLLSVTDARGFATTTKFDQAYRPINSYSNPKTGLPNEGNAQFDIEIKMQYDKSGNVRHLSDGNGNITRNAYDSLGRLIATARDPEDGDPIDPDGMTDFSAYHTSAGAPFDIVVSYQYDDSGNLTRVSDGRGQLTDFRYDGLGRKTHTIWDPGSALEKKEISTYNALFLIQTKNPNAGEIIDYRYDNRHRLVRKSFQGRQEDDCAYTYDLVGNLKDTTYPHDPVNGGYRASHQTYDFLDRNLTETSVGATHVYTYDQAGNRKTTAFHGGRRSLVSTYDSLNRLDTCTEFDDNDNSKTRKTLYRYDLAGNIRVKQISEVPGAVVLDSRKSYDALGRVLLNDLKGLGATTLSSFDHSVPVGLYPHSYDNVGNLLRIGEEYSMTQMNNRVVDNTYDKSYRLKTEDINYFDSGGQPVVDPNAYLTTYNYDKANNRTKKSFKAISKSYSYPGPSGGFNSNQMASETTRQGPQITSSKNYSYDENGNRESVMDSSANQKNYYYDYQSRLVQIVDTVLGTFDYSYDHRTRRVVRDETLAATAGTKTLLSFSGGTSAQEYPNNINVDPTIEYIRGSDYGGGVGGILYTIRDTEFSFNGYNSRGDVVTKTNGGGAASWQASYEAFGNQTQNEGVNNDRQKANTKDEDPTGLLNEGMRYRDLEVGIFLTRDPAGFVDGPNVYTYVRQNPWTMWDPLGLKSVAEALEDGKLSVNEARNLEFKFGQAEKMLEDNGFDIASYHEVWDDIVNSAGDGFIHRAYGAREIHKNTGSMDAAVRWHKNKVNTTRMKRRLVAAFGDKKAKGILAVANGMTEGSSILMLEGVKYALGGVVGKAAFSVGGKLIGRTSSALRSGSSQVAPRTPLGFSSADEFSAAGRELAEALQSSGLKVKQMGVRGSAVTNVSSKGGPFRLTGQGGKKPSDIDFFFELADDIPLNASKNIPGLIHPDKLMKAYPALRTWADKWSKALGREVSPGGFKPGTFTDPDIIGF